MRKVFSTLWNLQISARLQVRSVSFLCRLRALDRNFCFRLRSFFSAFVVTRHDSRVALREITHEPTFVFQGAYNLTLNVSDLQMFSSVPGSDYLFLESVGDSIMDAFRDVLGARKDAVFAVFGEERISYTASYAAKVHERSGYVVALNSSGQTRLPYNLPFDSFFAHDFNLMIVKNLAIDLFHQKTSSPELRNLVNIETLQVCFVTQSLQTAFFFPTFHAPANALQIPFFFSVIFSFFCRSSFPIPQQFLLFIKMQSVHLSSVPHLFCYSVFFLCPHDRNLMRLVRCCLWL